MPHSSLHDVREELRLLRRDVSTLMALRNTPPVVLSGNRFSLRVFFDERQSERTPFILSVEGSSEVRTPISSVRASILIILLLDLKIRGESRVGLIDPAAAIAACLANLSTAGEAATIDSIRVALYRFEKFFVEQTIFQHQDYTLKFNPLACRLDIESPHNGLELDVEITSSSPKLCAIIDSTLKTSPLNRLRREKALDVPAGTDGHDRLLLELFEHNLSVQQESLFPRPAIQSYPLSILEKCGASENRLKRTRLVLEGYKSGRCQYSEIWHRDTLLDFIRVVPGYGFKLHPPGTTLDEVADHLTYLCDMLRKYPTYHLHLTDAFFPFLLSAYSLGTGSDRERVTLFFRRLEQENLFKIGCFATVDPATFEAVSTRIVGWVAHHPTTQRRKEDVCRELEQLRIRLLSEGPIESAQNRLG